MKYLSLLIVCVGITLTSCEKCGHCNGPNGYKSGTVCGKADYTNGKNACNQLGAQYSWEDE